MKCQDTEPTMGFKVKGRKLCKNDTHLPIYIYSAAKAHDNIGWDNMMWGQISHHWNKWQSDYLK